jgi:hypothetical protein
VKQKDRIYNLPEINREIPKGSIVISYSQFSKWKKCPRSWKLAYIDKNKISKPSIHVVFGTAIHTCIQTWVKTFLTESVKLSEELQFDVMLLEELQKTYKKEMLAHGSHFSTKEELSEFYLDGLNILNWIRKKRTKYFDSRYQQLVGIEVPILLPPDPKKPGVLLMGYLDLVIRDIRDGIVTIFDIKTSTRGWKDWDKKDETKISQLLLYKVYFSEQYKVPLDLIHVEYLIVKRKIDEESEFAQRRVQTFVPAQKKPSLNKVSNAFAEFLETCFTDDSKYNTDIGYHPIAGSKYQNCRFCEYNNEEQCPMKDRICL